jgi:uncharacterized protein DUF3105
VAKKNERRNERRAIAEQLRKQQARKERTRSILILGGAVVIVVGLLTAALIPYIQQQRDEDKIASTPLGELGVSESAAGCQPIKTKKVDLKVQEDGTYHLPSGSPIDYPDAPPAFGYHWPNFLAGSEIRTFYTPQDRPEVERLVHSLEHGHTILWYDDSIKKGSEAYQQIQRIADKLGTESYLMAAPWTASDGKAFPNGTHVALVHWTGPKNQEGATQYCAKPSGQVIDDFLKKYPKSNAPEPGAM